MRKLAVYFFIVALIASCKTFDVTKEIKKSSILSKLKHSGIIFRIPTSSAIKVNRFNESLSLWFHGYKKNNNLTIINETSIGLNTSKTRFDRFFQLSMDEDFQIYKSTGVIYQYIQKNEEELNRILSENNLDSLIIYEVDSAFSPEMQFLDFHSMIIIIDANYKISYLDHQFDSYDVFEYDNEILIGNLLDKINRRFIEIMLKLDYFDEK